MVHVARLVRNGNSTTVTVPPVVLEALGWHRGDVLALGQDGDRIVLRRVADHELLQGPTPAPASRPRRRARR